MALSSPPAAAIDQLLDIMATLRDPVRGCPWDRVQTFSTIAPYTVEEAYEVADAVQRQDLFDLKDELGDLLLQVVFHAEIAKELGAFSFEDVVEAICSKMRRRHPHVFGDAAARSPKDQTQAWEDIKSQERRSKAPAAGVLADVPVGLPSLTRAVKLSKRAARVGFVWPTTQAVLDKVHEELAELEHEIKAGRPDKTQEELGDLLFVLANLGRDLDIDPEHALRGANAKFVRRFGFIEASLAAEGRSPEECDLEELDRLWNVARAKDKADAAP
jgi:tetrapyrrole methylase family protein/MazG family protein/ATP diphosphatase